MRLLLCMNSIVYILQTSYNTFVVFLKVLSHFIMKIKNFMKYFKELGDLKYFKISTKFFNISKWNISSCIIPIIPPHLKRVAVLICQYQHWKADTSISQDIAATRVRCDEVFNNHFISKCVSETSEKINRHLMQLLQSLQKLDGFLLWITL